MHYFNASTLEIFTELEWINGYYQSLEFDRFKHVKWVYMNGTPMKDFESI